MMYLIVVVSFTVGFLLSAVLSNSGGDEKRGAPFLPSDFSK
jgi:hypothetical protein